MLSTPQQVGILKTVSIFAGISDEDLVEIASLLAQVEAPAGSTIIERGEMGDCMFIVAEGRVRVHDGKRTIAVIDAGDVFGEMALLDPAPRSASVVAVEDTRLFRLDAEPLCALMAQRPEVPRGIIRVLSGRLRQRLQDVSSLSDRKEEIERELEIGRQIQAGFMPEALPRPPGWEIAAHFHPAREVAGDFYDAFPLADGELLGLVIADVSGKGVGAALFMSLTRTLLRAYSDQNFPGKASRRGGGREWKGPQALGEAAVHTVADTSNYIARVHGRAHMFATVFFGLLDVSSGVLTYVNAGHDAPAITCASGVKARLARTGAAVGLFPNMPFASQQVYLEPGDTLVMYTDGVVDAHDPEGEFFGQERLLSLIAEPHPTASALLERIEDALHAHIGAASRFDDETLLAVRRIPSFE